MVGLKSIWILLSTLLLFAACVPQTKQNQCNSNEAFNAALRSCVPVVGEPSSFTNIDSFVPTSSLTKYKSDTTKIDFTIVVSNPYSQTYTIQWQRNFNGITSSLSPTSTPTKYSVRPYDLRTQVGTHVITAKIVNSSGVVVDSHSFELRITDNPKPIIVSGSVVPALYATSLTPVSADQEFKFTIDNNRATNASGAKTEFRIYRSGVLIDTENVNLVNTDPTDTNEASYNFEPDTLGVGGYIVNARVINNVGEFVAEQQWSVTVAHPPLPKITNRYIYSGIGNPTFNAVTTAYNNIAYSSLLETNTNFVPKNGTPGSKGDYCVTVADEEGSYDADGYYVRVDYYLDGGTLIYSGYTSIGDNQVCLSEATPASILNTFIFSNASATTEQSHKLVARVVDEFTGTQYAFSDMNVGLGDYPITWDFNVKPQNIAPTVAFGAMSGITCDTVSGNVMSNCTTTSDTNFKVNISLVEDDFYTTASDEAQFNYSIRLYQNGINIQTCTKSDPGYTLATDGNGNDGYECYFNINSYGATGPINLAQPYVIQAEISDLGSPFTATGKTSQTLTWSFAAPAPNTHGVTETNTAPNITSWSVGNNITEGNSISFSANIEDPERDNAVYTINYCTNALCTTYLPLKTGPITRTTNALSYPLNVSHTLPEDFLLDLTVNNCHLKKRTESCAVSFLLTVEDRPDTATRISTSSSTAASNIINKNPAPVLNTAFSNPVPSTFSATTTFAFVGHPISFTNNPSSILTDISLVSREDENAFRYQWYIKNTTSVMAWTAIDGANTYNLIWTPSLITEANMATDNPFTIILCVEDHPSNVITTPNPTDSTCNAATPWIFTVSNNVAAAQDLSTAPTSNDLAMDASDDGIETAIWYDTPVTLNSITSSAAYIAMIDNAKKIHVKKVLVRNQPKVTATTANQIDTIDEELIVSFEAASSGTTYAVKDLSITGDDDQLYIAYLASVNGDPLSFYPQVRRIDLKANTKTKLAPNNHPGKFGFDYDGMGFTNSCSVSNDCTTTATAGVNTITFSPSSGSLTGSFALNGPNGDFIVDFNGYDGIDSICGTCSGTTMASNLAAIINTSTDPKLAGYSATASGNSVTIHGAEANDYFDASTDGSPRVADRMGKIYIYGSSWFVPFINSSLGSGSNDKLSAYTGTVGVNMSTVPEFIIEPPTSTNLSAMSAAVVFDNYLEGNFLWISMVSKTGSVGKLYKVRPNDFFIEAESTIFIGEALVDVQVAASSSNVYLGVTNVSGELKLAVYDTNASIIDEFGIDDAANTTAPTGTYFNTDDISKYKIVPYGTEARLFAVSRGASLTDYDLYVARLSSISSVWTLSCGDCISITPLGQNLSQYVGLGAAPVRDNPSSLYRLGSDGSVSSQGVKDVAFVSFGLLDIPATGCDPAIGVFNVEGEAIGSETIYSGSNAGLYRPPFIKN